MTTNNNIDREIFKLREKRLQISLNFLVLTRDFKEICEKITKK